MSDKSKAHPLSGIFIIDLQGLKLSQAQLEVIDKALQDTAQKELAKLDDTEGLAGGPLGGRLAGFRAD